MFVRLVVVLTAIVLMSETPSQENVKSPNTGADAYSGLPEPWKSKAVNDWNKKVEELKERVKEDKIRYSRFLTASAKKKVNDSTKELAELEKNNPPYYPPGMSPGERAAAEREAAKSPAQKAREAAERAAVRDKPPATWRDKFIQDWKREKEALKKAIEDDRGRLASSRNAADRTKYAIYIKNYSAKLGRMKNGDPMSLTDVPLGMGELKVGAYGDPTEINAKIVQVINKGSVLVGVEDRRNASGHYDTLVWVNCRTSGLADDTFIGPLHQLLQPRQFAYVSGTKTYGTVIGATRTVFIIDMVSLDSPYKPPER